MKRTALLTIVLAAALALPSSALGAGAGHNGPTKKLEAAFTVALNYRIKSKNGCYPPPRRLAPAITRWSKSRAGVAKGLGAARVRGTVYVITKGTNCNGIRLALRYKKIVYVLDSVKGEIRIIGRRKTAKDPSRVANRGPLRAVQLVERSFVLNRPDKRKRLDVRCPGNSVPLGGGMYNAPSLGDDGEGVYPNSYERLGAQRGWHVTGWLFDPSGGAAPARRVTLQTVCALGLAPNSAPHRSVFNKRRKPQKAVVARCPKGQYLMSGGYQRTDFLGWGGNYVTESRAVSPTAWRVAGIAHGAFGGELTAIAYCTRAGGPLLTEVSGSTPVPSSAKATATTPKCPDGHVLGSGGFSANGATTMWFTDGVVNPDNSWSASGFGRFGEAPTLTAYGYCLRLGV